MASDTWTQWPFEDVIDFQEGPGILAKDFRDEGVPLVRLSGLNRGASVITGCNFLDPDKVRQSWSHFALHEGDILLSTSASLGRIAVVGREGGGAIAYTGIIRMRPRDNRIYAPFIRYLLEGPDFQRQAEMAGVGSVIRHFGPMHLRQMMVTVPSIPEQRAIACILGALDDKIELNRRTNETMEAIARAIFKSWFVDFDPVSAKAAGQKPVGLASHISDLFPDAFEDSELGKIPKGWHVGGLDTIARMEKNSVLPAKEPQRRWEHYSIPAFDNGRIPAFERGDEIKSGKYVVSATSVLVSKLNPQFPRVWLPAVQDENVSICSTEFLPFIPLRPDWRPFLYDLMRSDNVQQGIQERVTGSTGSRQRAKPDDVAVMRIINPGSDMVEQFAAMVGPLHRKLFVSIQESRTLATIRDTLLPKLISGELRLKDAEKIAEEAG